MNESMNSLDSLAPFMERAKRSYELKELERLGLSPDLEQREAILTHLALVLQANKSADLIPEGDEDQIFFRHFCDSIQLLLLLGFKKNAVVLDIDSCGGFPAVPIGILRPDLTLILTESNRKRAAFLCELKAALKVNIMAVHANKPENIVLSKKVDYVITRRAGTLQKFALSARPFLSKDGRMYTYKTKSFTSELDTMTENKDRDGIRICEIAQYGLGGQMRGLHLVSMEFVR